MRNKFSRHLKRAKKFINEEVQNIESVIDKPQEQRVNILEETDEFKILMNECKEELEQLENEQQVFEKHNILKHRLVHLFVTGRFTRTQIARMLRVSPSTISKWLSDPDVQKAIENYQAQEDIIVGNTIKALRMKALDTMNQLMDSDNDLVALQASKDILDRSGHKAIDKKEIRVEMTYEERLKQIISGADYVIIDDDSDDSQINTEGEDISD